jgi:lysophospholipase L1-like esterase
MAMLASGCRSASPAWRVAWGATLDQYVANTFWEAHPTEPDSPTPRDATYRFIVRVTVGGTAVRLRLVNEPEGRVPSGKLPVTFDAVEVGIRKGTSGAALIEGTARPVTFGHKTHVTIAPRSSVVSDPVNLTVTRFTDLAVSVYSPAPSVPPLHALTYVTQYVTAPGAGDHAGDASGQAFTTMQEPIYWLDAIDVLTVAPRATIAIGDSVTDGVEGPTYTADFGMDKYPTYPDFLAQRIATTAGVQPTAVVNEGVTGDSSVGILKRLQHDVFDQPGVTDVVVEVGTNDLTMPAAAIVHNLREIASMLRSRGLHVMGATLVPQGGYVVDSPVINATRARVDAFIRTNPLFDDGVLDIAKVLGEPGDDNMYQPKYDSGDHLHPNTAGYRAIADHFNLAVLK